MSIKCWQVFSPIVSDKYPQDHPQRDEEGDIILWGKAPSLDVVRAHFPVSERWHITGLDETRVEERCVDFDLMDQEPVEDVPFNASMSIKQFLHCKKCIDELPGGESPESWARLNVGTTKYGFQIWCRRHKCNVLHINFEGVKHPGIVTA